MNKAIFLDRDGTLNEDTMYPHKIEDFKLLPGVIEGLKKLKENFIFVIITNQSGIGRGIHSYEDFDIFNRHLLKILEKEGIDVKKTYHCPHSPEEICECRKPSTKYIEEAAREFEIDVKSSWTIGDHAHDMEMGRKAGTRNVYMLTGHGKKHFDDLKKKDIKPDFIAEDFMKAAEFILENK